MAAVIGWKLQHGRGRFIYSNTKDAFVSLNSKCIYAQRTSIKRKLSWFNCFSVTQINQMFVRIYIHFQSLNPEKKHHCPLTHRANWSYLSWALIHTLSPFLISMMALEDDITFPAFFVRPLPSVKLYATGLLLRTISVMKYFSVSDIVVQLKEYTPSVGAVNSPVVVS